jgi:CubicO group peptidase (beta-lactamase class C family)
VKATLLLILISVTHFISAQNRTKQFDSILNSLYTNKKINGNFLVAEKGKVIYSKSFGYADVSTKELIKENSVFELASCSKQFTAMAIMVLKEKGKLKLDDDLAKYIPELDFYKSVTIRNLLNHTGGLPDYMELMDTTFDKTKMAVNKDIIALLAKYKPKALFAPNTKYEYSNTGYALLASVIEKVSGESYADFLNKNIFAPLQMKNTLVYTRRYAPKKIKNYAYGYVYSDSLKKYILPDDMLETKMVIWIDGIVGDGCVNSNVTDLLKWDRALYTTKLLSQTGMNELFEVATLNDSTKTNYGFGWAIDNHKEYGKIVNHSGGWPGYATFIERHVSNDKTIIILQNHDDIVFPMNLLRCVLYNKPLPVKKERKEIPLTVAQQQKLLGVYLMEDKAELSVTMDNEQMYVQLTGQKAIPVFAESELLLFLKIVDAQLEFEQNEKGEINKVYILQNDNKMEGNRIR